MAIALTLSAAMLAAIVGGLLYLALFVPDGWSLGALLAMILVPGVMVLATRKERRKRRSVPDDAERRLRRVTQRLAVVADVPAPRTVVIGLGVPLSWTLAPPGRPPTIHVTTGLLRRLEDRELEAVVAHEFGHLLHRDAIVMTLLAGPPAAFFIGLRELPRFDPWRGWLGVFVFGLLFGLPAVVIFLLSRIVSRHRELAADRAAALLTGSPAAVAAALVAVDSGLERGRDRDLRSAATRDSFHFVPVRVPRGLGRLWATHPPLGKRVDRMQRLEAGMQR